MKTRLGERVKTYLRGQRKELEAICFEAVLLWLTKHMEKYLGKHQWHQLLSWPALCTCWRRLSPHHPLSQMRHQNLHIPVAHSNRSSCCSSSHSAAGAKWSPMAGLLLRRRQEGRGKDSADGSRPEMSAAWKIETVITRDFHFCYFLLKQVIHPAIHLRKNYIFLTKQYLLNLLIFNYIICWTIFLYFSI